MQNNIKIYIVGEENLFNSSYVDNLKRYGDVIYLKTSNYIDRLINSNDKKIIVFDPDFGGWSFPREILENSSNILAIFLGTTDKSYIDLEYCDSKKIKVFNIPRYAADSVAEYLIMYMFACAKKIPLQIKNNNKQVFTDEFQQVQLKDKKVGIVGFGNIGSRVANICNGIGMKVYYWDRNVKKTSYEYLDLEKLFSICDVIYLCLSINDETKNIITDILLNKLKKDVIFISCTGKNLFNYRLIEEKIKNNEIFGYALEEKNKPFSSYDGNVMVTSEYAWFTKEASQLRIDLWVKTIIDFLNLVNN